MLYNVFVVTFDQFNASLLKKSSNFVQKILKHILLKIVSVQSGFTTTAIGVDSNEFLWVCDIFKYSLIQNTFFIDAKVV